MRRGLPLVALLVLGMPAHAENPASSAVGGGPNTAYSKEKANKFSREVFTCLVQRDPDHAARLLQTGPGSYEEARIADAMGNRISQCMRRAPYAKMMWTDELSRRGGVAEATYHRDFSVGTPLIAGAVDFAWPMLPTGGTPERVALHIFARCVVAARPAAAVDLMTTTYATPEETRVIAELRSEMAACMDKGGVVRTDRATLRGIVAEQLLVMSKGARAQTQSAGALR